MFRALDQLTLVGVKVPKFLGELLSIIPIRSLVLNKNGHCPIGLTNMYMAIGDPRCKRLQ